MQTCTSDKFGEIVLKQFTRYSAQVQSKLSEETLRVGKDCAKKLRKISPKRHGKNGGRYAKGWRVKKDAESPYTVSVVVHNETDYQLTHLLENGHATVDGGRTQAIPHIRVAEKEAVAEYLKRAEEIIRG